MISKQRLSFKNSLPAKALKILFFILLAMYSFAAEAATVTWDGDANDGLWGSPTNWDGNILPTSADDVVIDNGDAVTLSSGTGQALSVKLENGSDLVISSSGTLNADRITGVFCTDCDLTNSGTINVQGSGSGTGIRIYGNIINNNGATISISGKSSGFSVPTAGSTFDNYGIINFTGAGAIASGINADQFNNYGSGVVSLANIGDIGVSADNFDTDGSLTISGTGDGINSDELNNSGTLDLTVGNSADAISAYNFYNSGTIGGNGIYTFNNTQSLGGVLAPGNSPGTMTFQGNQNFLVSNTMQMEVNGTTPNTEHDQIIVNGTATISGTLDATINYTPTGQDRIVIISATAISGTFSTINPALPANWIVDYSVAGEVALVYDYQDGLWDGDANDGLWTTAANWDGDILPSSTADIVINNGDAVTLSSGTIDVKSISLTNSSDLTIDPGVNITVSNFSSRGIDIPCGDCTFTNSGILTITGKSVAMYSDSPINSDGVIIISNCFNSGIFSYSNFTNSGLINLTGPFSNKGIYLEGGATNNASGSISLSNAGQGGIEHFGPPFTNLGSISVSGGTTGFQTSDLVNSGTITVSGASNLAFYIGSSIDNASGTLGGGGSFQLGGAATSLDLDGTVDPGPGIGIMTFTDDQTFTASGTIKMTIGNTTTHDQIIVNGTATIGGALDAFIPYLSPANGDRIVIISATAISGTFSSDNLPSNWSIDYSVAGEVALVFTYQDGLWDGDAGDNLWTTAANWDGDLLPSTNADVVINNAGEVTLPSGTVTVNTLSINNGLGLIVSSGATLNVNNSGPSNTVSISGSALQVNVAGTVNITGGGHGIDMNGVEWSTRPGGETHISSYSGDGYYATNGGTLDNRGTMTISGGLSGVNISDGQLNTNSGSVLTVQNTSGPGISVIGGGIVSNWGSMNLNNCVGTSLNAETIFNAATGNLSITNSGGTGIHAITAFTNWGTLTITGATTGIYLDDANYENTGSFTISGTSGPAFDFDDNGGSYTFSNTGTLKGTGTFDMAGNSLGGTIAPGTSPGTMTYPVSQTFTASSTIEVEVNGTTPNTEHDQIVVNGTATISGTLDAAFNYTPSNNDRIVIISATAISGTFSSISPALPFDWSIDYSVAGEVALVYSYTPGKWDGAAGDGQWTTANNWEGRTLPGAADDVVIDNGDAVTLSSGTVTVHTITLSSGSDLSISSGATLNVN